MGEREMLQDIMALRLTLLNEFGAVIEDVVDNIDVNSTNSSRVADMLRACLDYSKSSLGEPTAKKTSAIKTEEDIKKMSVEDLRREVQRLLINIREDINKYIT